MTVVGRLSAMLPVGTDGVVSPSTRKHSESAVCQGAQHRTSASGEENSSLN